MEQMNKEFTTPKRVWINCPSTLQPYHKFHGKVGIAHTSTNSLGYTFTRIYFTRGDMLNIEIDPLYLETKNSQNNNLRYGTDNKETIEFAEWIAQYQYEQDFDTKLWSYWDNGLLPKNEYTTEELFNMFKKEKYGADK